MAIFVFLLLITPFVIHFIRYNFSRIIMENCSQLDPNATIIDVHSKSDNWGKNKHIRTIVQFSDGSEYHTHYARHEPGFGYTRIVVDKEVVEHIKAKAIAAHKKKVDKGTGY